jgi:hypothetical protein
MRAPANPNSPIDAGAPISPTSIEYHREETRSKLAFALIAIFGVEVLAALATFVFPHQLGIDSADLASVKDILSIVFSPTVALVGSAMGFYFGTEGKKQERADRS